MEKILSSYDGKIIVFCGREKELAKYENINNFAGQKSQQQFSIGMD